jgi:hypothetical protein
VPRSGIIVASRERALCSGGRDGELIEGATAGDPASDPSAILGNGAMLPESEGLSPLPPPSGLSHMKFWRFPLGLMIGAQQCSPRVVPANAGIHNPCAGN